MPIKSSAEQITPPVDSGRPLYVVAGPDIPAINPDDIIPKFETDVFAGKRQEAAFYVGILATPQTVVDEDAWNAARILRASVYIDEMKLLPENARKEDGGEDDHDDLRSVQFGVYENTGSEEEARMVGTSRLILKRDEGDLLPVETMHPEVFGNHPAEINSKDNPQSHIFIAYTRYGCLECYGGTEACLCRNR
jgi:hypothetical protein